MNGRFGIDISSVLWIILSFKSFEKRKMPQQRDLLRHLLFVYGRQNLVFLPVKAYKKPSYDFIIRRFLALNSPVGRDFSVLREAMIILLR